jgi:isoleucyl-tRNA synthetase
MQHLQNFTTNQLSAFYFDVIKDRVYNEPQNASSRRMAQTVLYEILHIYTKALSPVACHTAEEIYEHYRCKTPRPESSIFKASQDHQQHQLGNSEEWNNPDLMERWTLLKDLKNEVNQVLEQARQEK